MPITTGRTKMIALLMDLQAVLMQIQRQFTDLLSKIDTAIQVDLSDDHLWKAVDDHLTTALTLENVTDVHAEVNKARRNLRDAMKIDLSDASKEAIRGSIVPRLLSVERLIERANALQEELEQ